MDSTPQLSKHITPQSLTAAEIAHLAPLQVTLGYQFQKIGLLARALTHRSYLNEIRQGGINHNERLEFLGDAVLELISTEHLFTDYPERSEGDLTSFRAAVVRTESLADSALELGFGDYIYMSKGEDATGGRTRPYILANTFEAILGAMYLDGGIDVCKAFVARILLPKLPNIVENRLDLDAKSRLQELAQEQFKFTPIYELVGATGPDHDKTFTVQVLVQDRNLGSGSGRSKQEAEQAAAHTALKALESDIIQS